MGRPRGARSAARRGWNPRWRGRQGHHRSVLRSHRRQWQARNLLRGGRRQECNDRYPATRRIDPSSGSIDQRARQHSGDGVKWPTVRTPTAHRRRAKNGITGRTAVEGKPRTARPFAEYGLIPTKEATMRFAAFACCAVLALPLPVEAGCVDGDTRTCAMGGGCPGESECVGGRWTPCLCTVQFDGQEAGPCSIRATPLDGAGCVAQYGGGTLKCTTRCAGTCDIDTSPGSLQWQSTTMLPNDGLRAFEAVECGGGPGTCPFTDSQNSTTYNFEHGRSKLRDPLIRDERG